MNDAPSFLMPRAAYSVFPVFTILAASAQEPTMLPQKSLMVQTPKKKHNSTK